MKGHAAVTTTSLSPAKQWRWKWLALTVLLLVFFSMLVPLAFLLGLHNGLPVGYLGDDNAASDFLEIYGHGDGVTGQYSLKDDSRAKQMLLNFTPSLPQEIVQSITGDGDGKSKGFEPDEDSEQLDSQPTGVVSNSDSNATTPFPEVVPKPPADAFNVQLTSDSRLGDRVAANPSNGSNFYGSESSCQLEFGSYCLWSKEHKESMKDATVKIFKDQLFVARAYYPSIAKLQGQENLSREMKQNIQEHERILSEVISDADLPPIYANKIQKMEQTIAKAKGCTVECSNVERKLRQLLDLTEDETHFHMKQSAFLFHLGVQTMPKSLHCLSMRLTVEYFREPPPDMELSLGFKLDDPRFRHYVIFTRHILAVSVTINSTVMNSKDTADMIFHLITDRQNFYAMKLWFARNSYNEAIIHVLNIEDLSVSILNGVGLKQFSTSEEFRISVRGFDQTEHLQLRTEYISTFGPSHFLLPEIFKNLKKVIVLDDDVIVQQDLSSLWTIDLEGKVNGAVNFCKLQLGQLEIILGRSILDRSLCLWTSGLNIIDLEKWREHNITGIYHKLLPTFHNGNEETWRTAALPTSLLAFQGHVFPLDSMSIISGLGHDYHVSEDVIKTAAALHYNGNMKPWLDLGIPTYKKYWKKFLIQGEPFMDQCNVRH
ncbi:probable galacturonosyltransferase 7 [Phalaenopsis equestris]|uniref:probable galacturonosyltransferase 7 n=1 Tax=Phalaenopsis equestris TaxID=78828 RepID=UPI0009E564E0|nr:probable galacturonosyltransferase 7 [Phalaenopsis equestris]